MAGARGSRDGAWSRHVPWAHGLAPPRVLGPEQGQQTGSGHGKRAKGQQRGKGRGTGAGKEREKTQSEMAADAEGDGRTEPEVPPWSFPGLDPADAPDSQRPRYLEEH